MSPSNGHPRPRRWAVQRRIEFIEFRLAWQGTLNRGDLREQFGISDPQASADIAAYRELAPGNCEYDRKAKVFRRGKRFESVVGRFDSQVYLNELRSVAIGSPSRDASWIGDLPSFAMPRIPSGSIDDEVLSDVIEAMSDGLSLSVLFQSASRGEASWRWIAPHSLGFDGERWFARAFCHRLGAFTDFPLNRILRIAGDEAIRVDRALDREWEEEIEIEIGPHPELPLEQVAAAELDYGMKDGKLRLLERAALVPYLLRAMPVDLEPRATNPRQSRIALLNKVSVDEKSLALRKKSAELIDTSHIARPAATASAPAVPT